MDNQATRSESGDLSCACSMPCTWGPVGPAFRCWVDWVCWVQCANMLACSLWAMQRMTKSFPCFRQRCFMQLAWESLPTETSKGRHQCFSVVVQASPKTRPRPAHDRTTEASLVWMTGGEGWVCWVKCANMWIPASLFSIKVLYASLPVCQLKPSRQNNHM